MLAVPHAAIYNSAMESVTIFPVLSPEGNASFRAVSRGGQSEGRTAGEALDAIAPSLPGNAGAVVVIQSFMPDAFFTAAQQARLQDLMTKWREARDAGRSMPASDQAELQSLVEAELQAATARTAEALRGLGA
jgi:hypothetical protein